MPCVSHVITAVAQGSPADRAGIRPGDVLLRVGGEPVLDEIDYQALIAQRNPIFELDRGTFPLRRNYEGEAIGLSFGESMVLKPRVCHNHCAFCFIEQMPPKEYALRDSLYVKDDDWRFSLMMGNFVTLTNVSEEEMDRIIRRHASPLYISVHTTDPELRVKMMRNPAAAELMPRLRRLSDAGIRFHCQIVLCPGFNDGEALMKTLRDLKSLAPAVQSVAMVPVGLTRFREHLTPLTPYTPEMARQLLEQLKPFQQECREEMGTTFAFPSDEFYSLAGMEEMPPEEWYEDFPQIENGVGLIRRLLGEMEGAKGCYGPCEASGKRLLIPTGVSFAPYLRRVAEKYASSQSITVLPVKNQFFGETVTVTGLLTGRDVLEALLREPLSSFDEILLCRVMLRHEQDLFLDNLSIEEFQAALPLPVRLVENDGFALYEALNGLPSDESPEEAGLC